MSSLGAKILHNRCVAIGKKYNVPISSKSSFDRNSEGSELVKKSDLESFPITAITKDDSIVKIIIKDIKTNENIFQIFNEINIPIDMIQYSFDEHNNIEQLIFTIKENEEEKAINTIKENFSYLKINYSNENSKISIVGIGLVNNPKIITKIFEVLLSNKININMISTSEIKISILVDRENSKKALQLIHDSFLKKD